MSTLADYRFVIASRTSAEHFDWQGHLNNSAAAKLLEDARRFYMVDGLGKDITFRLRDEFTTVVRELHVSYETQGYPHEHFRCGARIVSRTDKAYVFEERLEEATSGRLIVQAWTVMLLASKDGTHAVPIPDWFWSRVEEFEGRSIPPKPRDRTPWGPPGT
jgi:acyl-CoA thioesterase FadM